MKNEHRAEARKLYRADIQNGGKGDPEAVYAKYIQKFKSDYKESSGIRSIYGIKTVKDTMNAKTDGDNDDGIVVEEENPQRMMAYTAMVVIDFMDGVIPTRNLFKEKRGNFFSMVVLNHEYFRALSGASMGVTRTIRFLGIVIIVLSEFFINTLFFGIFYPSDGTCNVYTTKVIYVIFSNKIVDFL